MTDGASRVFTIPAGVAFADALAQGLLNQSGGDPLRLADMLILLPTRRAVRAVTDGFLRIANGRALLLPRLLALADVDDDAALFGAESLPPAIEPLDRLFLLARLVLTAGRDFAATPDQALRLAAALADCGRVVAATGRLEGAPLPLHGPAAALDWLGAGEAPAAEAPGGGEGGPGPLPLALVFGREAPPAGVHLAGRQGGGAAPRGSRPHAAGM